jgi:hypothetical protein
MAVTEIESFVVPQRLELVWCWFVAAGAPLTLQQLVIGDVNKYTMEPALNQ